MCAGDRQKQPNVLRLEMRTLSPNGRPLGHMKRISVMSEHCVLLTQ